MIASFVAALLSLVLSISTAATTATPASNDSNPSETLKETAQAVSTYVKENNPSVSKSENKPEKEHPIHPDTPKNDKDKEESISDLPIFPCTICYVPSPVIITDPGGPLPLPVVETPSEPGAGRTLSDTLPDSAKTDGKVFGENVSDSVSH